MQDGKQRIYLEWPNIYSLGNKLLKYGYTGIKIYFDLLNSSNVSLATLMLFIIEYLITPQ